MTEELPKGFTCECGKVNEYTGYVYAHWRDELIHECTKRKHLVVCGYAELLNEKGEETTKGKRTSDRAREIRQEAERQESTRGSIGGPAVSPARRRRS